MGDNSTELEETPLFSKINKWISQEVLKTGWLNVKQDNNWLKVWFVLTPQHLKYHRSEAVGTILGEVAIDSNLSVIHEDKCFTLQSGKTYYVFTVSDGADVAMELGANTLTEVKAWVKMLYDIIIPKKSPTRKQFSVNNQSTRSKYFAHQNSKDTANEIEKSPQILSTPIVNGHGNTGEEETGSKMYVKKTTDTENNEIKTKSETKKDMTNLIANTKKPVLDKTDNKAFEDQIEKIRVVFLKIDKNGNGQIDRNEFADFMNGMGTKMDIEEINGVFETVDKDDSDCIYFEEFVDYFLKFVMGKSDDKNSAMRTAFLEADKDGSGAVNFREFTEFVYAQKINMTMDKLMTTFSQLDKEGKGEVRFEDFNQIMNEEEGVISKYENGSKKSQHVAEDFLRTTYQNTDVTELATYLKTRWDKFADFKRYGENGELAMTGSVDIVEDIVPGSYSLVDLACYNDLPPIEPEKAIIKGITWVKSNIPGKSGKAIFPADFDGVIPVEIATNENLAYYGSSLANGNQLKVSIVLRNAVQDFTYSDAYLDDYVTAGKEEGGAGGAGIECHDFSHLDCPLTENSGYFLVGKLLQGGEMHLTAFKVPTRHTIYVPGGVVHSNDYLMGTWRTMLSDEASIDHVLLVRKNNNNQDFEHFNFSFKENWQFVG